MSQATLPAAQQDAVAILPIMREYRDKLEQWLEPLLTSNEKVKRRTGSGLFSTAFTTRTSWADYLFDQLGATIPLVEKIASNASGLLEHTELDFLTERELKLRLTELEVLFKHYHSWVKTLST